MRSVRIVAGLLVTLAWLPLALAGPGADEGALRATMNQALWPGDIFKAAEQYLQKYPKGAAADEAQTLRTKAQASWQLVTRTDVKLYRTAFKPDQANAGELRNAALGNAEAAVRLARAARAAGAEPRYEGWMQYAASLGDQGASYELALYYRTLGQPVLASRFEELALVQGYQPVQAMDNVRK